MSHVEHVKRKEVKLQIHQVLTCTKSKLQNVECYLS